MLLSGLQSDHALQGILLDVGNDRGCYSTKCAQINLNLQSSINTIKGKIFILQLKSGRERGRGMRTLSDL